MPFPTWANSGEFRVGGVWENSFNLSGEEEGGRRRDQRHYQRLQLLDITNSACVVPPDITHTVFLRSLDTGDAWAPDVLQTATAAWAAVEPKSTTTMNCHGPSMDQCY